MKNSEKYKLKNQILLEISNKRGISLIEIGNKINKPIGLVGYLVEEIRDDNYITLIETTTKFTKDIYTNYLAELTNKGAYFLEIESGYNSTIKAERQKKVWYYTKTIAVVLNSIAILLIGFYSILVIKENNKLEIKNTLLENELNELKKELSSKVILFDNSLEVKKQNGKH
jgi:hypothetical protein